MGAKRADKIRERVNLAAEKFSLHGKTAVVTGGAGLIGKEVVKGLAMAGAKTWLADIDEKAGLELEKQNKEAGLDVKWIAFDVTKAESIKSCIDSIVKDNGRIDIWVNCAYPRTKGWSFVKFEDIKSEDWKKNVDMQLNSTFVCCQQVAEQMKKQGKGSIINFGSIYGMQAPDFSIYEGTNMTLAAAYCAIKAGIINFTKYLASYYAKHGIRVNAVCPGAVLSNQPNQFVERYAEKVPMGRMARAEEIAGPVVFLASDAASYVTGHTLMVDGGWTAV